MLVHVWFPGLVFDPQAYKTKEKQSNLQETCNKFFRIGSVAHVLQSLRLETERFLKTLTLPGLETTHKFSPVGNVNVCGRLDPDGKRPSSATTDTTYIDDDIGDDDDDDDDDEMMMR
ncbi:hypothetical protein PoB_002680300 [Plakobranchus ocellatus]|uniref:Uncharacterized protein n=1 Tax=Plakobranchus ocellatus TaxID=259542 RepID=A0AAV4A0Y3_9GAST|nr:hypothetical protein PoB_002680300 [Plakobranchus ocellatus]